MSDKEPRIWKPTTRQEQFLSLPDSIFEALYGGAVGGGKSELLVILPIARNFHLNRKFKGIILRRTFPELEKEIVNRSYDYYSATGATYNKQDKIWRFPSGAQIHFGHAENEIDIKRYDGVEYNLVSFDELESFTEFQYLYMFTRARSASSDLPAIVRCSAMPGGPGHAFVRKRFVEPHITGSKIIVDKLTGSKRFFLQSLPTDNSYLMKNDPGYLDRLHLLPEAERRAKLGDWFTFTGQVFDDFRVEPLPSEPENAKHVCEPFSIPDYWPKVNFTDWGFTANTASLWGAISPQGQVFIYREYIVNKKPVAEWATEIGEFCRLDKNIKMVGLDSNAWDQRGEEKTVAEQFEYFSKISSLGLVAQQASKGRISGKMLVQEYLRWRQRPKISTNAIFDHQYAGQLLHIKGLDAYNEYLKQFRPEPDEQNLPKLQIFADCKELIRVLPLCIYDEKNKEDVAEFEGDDVYDCLRYLLKGISRYLDESKIEFEKIRRLDEIETRLRVADPTSYHIYRSKFEAERRTQPISRFHKRVRTM